MLLLLLASVTLLIWVGMAFFHGRFWQIEPAWRGEEQVATGERPAVVAVIPARNEAEVISETLRSLWAQDYPGRLRVVLVDDHSDDGTAEVARQAARERGREADLAVISAHPLQPGWTGKVSAMNQGVTRGIPADDPAKYVLFSDADISHGRTALRELVSRAETGGLDLASFMVRLQCRSLPEKLMIPAFVFFFRMLYPFPRANNPKDRLAAAAGGTMLVTRTALERIGGLASIRHELIDDCSLAREVKRGGHPTWLGLGRDSVSTRGYGTLDEILRMIARTAYTQLGYSPLQLAGCVLGLGLTFLAPPLLLLAGGWPAALGGLAWLVMTALYLPMVRFYRRSPLWAPLLPVTATVYLYATLLSAWRHHRGQGGQWKGRSQSAVVEARVAE